MAGFTLGSTEWLGSLFDENFGCAFIFKDGGGSPPGINPLKPPVVSDESPLKEIVDAAADVNQGIDFLSKAYSTIRKQSLLAELKSDVIRLQNAVDAYDPS